MDSQRWPTVLTEILGNVVGNTLRTDEDENFGILLTDLIEVLDEFRPFLKVAADFNDLGDVMVSGELHRTDVDLNEVLEEILTKIDNMSGNNGVYA